MGKRAQGKACTRRDLKEERMTLREFIKLLDTMLPVTIYYDSDSYGPYKTRDIPSKWLNRKVFQIIIDEDFEVIGIDVA